MYDPSELSWAGAAADARVYHAAGGDAPSRGAAVVVAGDQLIVGLDNQVSILSIKTGKSLWQAPVTGKSYGITAAEGRLIVSTDLGYIHTFHFKP